MGGAPRTTRRTRCATTSAATTPTRLTVPQGWALQDRRVRYPAALGCPDFRGGPGPAYPAPVNEVATAPVPRPPKVQRWGIPDALLGWVVVYLGRQHLGRRGRQRPPGNVGEDFDDLPARRRRARAARVWPVGFFLVPWAVTKVKGNGIVADLGVRARWEDLWKGGLAGIAHAGGAAPAAVLADPRAARQERRRPRGPGPDPHRPGQRARSTSSCSCSSWA